MNLYLVLLMLVVISVALVILYFVANGASSVSNQEKVKVKNKLYSLSGGSNSSNVAERRDTIIQADSLVAKAMQIKLHNSLSFGENLKKLRGQFPKKLYNDIWEAHKKRNKMVHEHEEITVGEANEYYKTFKQAINKLI